MLDPLEALRAGLAPHYTVEREIGSGGMARVYLAQERHPPRKVAIKVMNQGVSTVSEGSMAASIEATAKSSRTPVCLTLRGKG